MGEASPTSLASAVGRTAGLRLPRRTAGLRVKGASMKRLRLLIACAVVVIGVTIPLTARRCRREQDGDSDVRVHAEHASARVLGASGPARQHRAGQGSFNSDLAFWGNTAVQGTYAGFRLVDVSAPSQPEGDRQLGAVRQPEQQQREPGRRPRLGRPRHPLLELGDARAASTRPGTRWRVDHPGHRSRRASRRRARSAATGRCSASRPPAAGCPSAARRACTSSTSAIRRILTSLASSTRLAARTRRRSFRISRTTGSSSTATRLRTRRSASPVVAS